MAQSSAFIRPGQSVSLSLAESGATVYASGADVSYGTGTITAGSSTSLYGTQTFSVDASSSSSASLTIVGLPVLSQGSSVAATAVKTGAYAAAASDLIPVDASAGAVTVTLPTAPADKSLVTVKKIDTSTNAVTIARGGTDVFNKAGGSTSLSLTLANQSAELQYAAGTGVWYVKGSDTPVASLKTSLQATAPVTVDTVQALGTIHHAHRGAGRWMLENTLEGLQLAAAVGHVAPDGGDFQFSADGKGISQHTSTIVSGDFVGPGSVSYAGQIGAVSARGFKAMKVGSANYSYHGVGPAASPTSGIFVNVPDGTTMTMEDYAVFYAARPGLLWPPELKDPRCGAELLALIVKYGLQKRTIVGSFTIGDLAPFTAIGVKTAVYKTSTAGLTAGAAVAAGVDYLGYSYTDASWTAGAVQAYADAGLRLWPFTFTRRSEITAEAARVGRPLSIVTCDYGIYSGRTVKPALTDPYKEGVPFLGQIPSASNPGSFYRASAGKFSIVGASRVLQGWGCFDVTDWASGVAYNERDVVQQDTGLWVCNTAHTSGATFAADSAKWTVYKLTFTLTWETVGAAGSTGVVIAFGCADDSDITAGTTIQQSGFLWTIKKDGTSAISRWNGATSRQTVTGPANNSGGAVARVDGESHQFTAEFLTGANAGKIKLSDVTAGTTATLTDNATGGATSKRGYLTFGTTAADLDVSFSGVALT